MSYRIILGVEIYDTLVATQIRICFEILIQEFDTIFDYTFQEGPKLNPLNIKIIQSENNISIDQTYHIIKNIIQEYWVTKKNIN